MEKPGLNFDYMGGRVNWRSKGKGTIQGNREVLRLFNYYVIILKLLLNQYIALQTAFTRSSTQTMTYNVQGIYNFF